MTGINPNSKLGSVPVTETPRNPPPLATRPGRDPKGQPLSDKDVWGGLTTESGRLVITGDGIDMDEAMALGGVAQQNTQEFIQRLDADSNNETPEVKWAFKKPFEGIGDAFVNATARNSRVLIEAGVSINSAFVKEALKEYLAPEDKQNDKPVIGKMTITGKANEQGEIGDLKVEATIGNLPKFSRNKIGEYDKIVASLLALLPKGEVITDEMLAQVAKQGKDGLLRSSSMAVEFINQNIERPRTFNVDVSGDERDSVAHMKVGMNAVDIRVDHIIDEFQRNYPRIDGQTKVTVDKTDHDTVDLGTLRMYSTENLVVAYEGNKSRLFRVEKDGTRTELNDVIGQILVYLPFVMMFLANKGIKF